MGLRPHQVCLAPSHVSWVLLISPAIAHSFSLVLPKRELRLAPFFHCIYSFRECWGLCHLWLGTFGESSPNSSHSRSGFSKTFNSVARLFEASVIDPPDLMATGKTGSCKELLRCAISWKAFSSASVHCLDAMASGSEVSYGCCCGHTHRGKSPDSPSLLKSFCHCRSTGPQRREVSYETTFQKKLFFGTVKHLWFAVTRTLLWS